LEDAAPRRALLVARAGLIAAVTAPDHRIGYLASGSSGV
jgi:hypothetical protein